MTIRHNCETQGCYIKEQTPDWGFTDSAFSGKIRIGDIDGAVEANGCLLLLEWKSVGAPLTKGQEIMYSRITKNSNIIVFVINGDAKHTESDHLAVFKGGELIYDDKANNEKIKLFCREWETKARANEL
ncbi:MAG: hypothetical protein D8M57_13130 [Candidatus Scalindua sp. AMX11]|nr:MAG: hypothetical protein DWQ00_11960 [Candidatus Scalindua sp.]NOG83783.1 hypothetical protein [Planctomycetota bacterium]RZV82940.1 MAG: hypothetical protein EX341_09115 [Candidatus Scalindua sp. SCAELEC01]TDE64438.1 MAG: hypothetical protein D8M57_13130 [Candidatus Scalindua sp. AMX11]GJQ59764.1 MAG: hypothetical protein SCALA701_25650 [Candidatus Scalindua sp.]